MKRRTLFTYIFVPHLIALLLTLLAAGGWALRGARNEHSLQTRDNLRAAAMMLADSLNHLDDPQALENADRLCKSQGQAAGYRFTVVLNTGRVIGDTLEDPAVMDNHYGRPEIRSLLSDPDSDLGWFERRSATIGMNMMYLAVPWLHNGERLGFVRAARALDDIDLSLARQRIRIIYAGMWLAVLVIIGSAMIAGYLSAPLVRMRQAVQTYSTGRTGFKLPPSPVAEIHALTEAMNDMASRLDERINVILRQRDEQNALFDCMTEAVLAIDTQGCVLSMNPAASAIFSVDSQQSSGRPIQEVVRNADLHKIWRKTMDSPLPVEDEFTIPDGERCLQAHGTAMTDGQGRRIGCVIVMTDVTRMRQLETMRRDFVANVSHELKTPVTSISGFADTLLEGAAEDPENRRRFLTIIQRQARRLAAILDDLLTLSRLEYESEHEGIALQPVHILPLLQNALKTFQEPAARKTMRLSVECAPDLTAALNAPLIEQAIFNLVGNAVKYGQEGTVVNIAAQRDDGKTLISVTDQGPGIARHHLPRLFERFYRIDKGRSREMGGTGLGLAIVKRVALAHGGRVEVQSASGKGSVFTIHLPPAPA